MKETFIKGKVKTVFATSEPDEVLIQYEDRVTAGNGKKELWIENKGAVCCEISKILFELLEKHGIRHIILVCLLTEQCAVKR
jgi:phosphoribosylaminoimidazole-succinocarboxamide synthase